MATNRTSNHTQAAHRRITQRVFPLVLAAFAIIGFIGLFSIRGNAFNSLGKTHQLVLADVSREIFDDFDHIAEAVTLLTEDDTIQRFGQETSSFSRSALFLRNAALGLFVAEIEANPGTIQRLRYINADGEIRIEVINSDLGVEVAAGSGLVAPEGLYADTLLAQRGTTYLLSPRAVVSITNPPPLTEPVFSLAVPVFADDEATEPLGVIQTEVAANRLLDAVTMIETSPLLGEPGRRLILYNNEGLPLADSVTMDVGLLLSNEAEGIDQPMGLSGLLQDITGDIPATNLGNLVVSAHEINSVLTAPDMPWRLVVADDIGLIFSDSNSLSSVVFFFSLVIGVVIAAGVSIALRQALQPYDRAASLAQQLVGGQPDVPVVSQGEDDALTQAVTHMSAQVTAITDDMEAQRQRLKGNLEIVARISRETANQDDPETLLNRVLDLICVEYQFRHAQIFLIDETATHITLAYTYDLQGREMLQQGLKPPIDVDTMVAEVIETGAHRVSSDRGGGDDNERSPVMPETRSRLVLPLLDGDRTIGALDVQSEIAAVFGGEEIQAFELLADQVSKAIFSQHLLRESDERVRQIDVLNRELTRSAWEDLDEKLDIERAYHYDLHEVRPGDAQAETDGLVSMPINVRGHVIGSLDVAAPDGQSFTPDEALILSAVTDRVALAIDRARLFQETQLSLSETSLLYDMARRINEATELEAIIQAIVITVMPNAIGGQIVELERRAYGEAPAWATVTAEWYDAEHSRDHEILLGLRLSLTDDSFLSDMPGNEPTLVNDVNTYPNIDQTFKQALLSRGSQALVALPLTIRNTWHSTVIIEFEQPQRFGEQDKRVFSVLIDQASVAIDNSLLLQQTEAALEETNRLYTASRAISSALDLTAVYEETAQHLIAASRMVHQIMILLARPDPAQDAPYMDYAYVWSRGANPAASGQVASDSLPYPRLAQSGAVLIADAASDLSDQPDVAAMLTNDGIRSLVVTPLQSRQQWFGLLVCASDQAGAFDDKYTQFVQTVGDQVAIAIENHVLNQATEAERATLSSILETMPSGVLVLDAETYLPLNTNQQTETLLGKPLDLTQPFRAEDYNLYRTGTSLHYADEELPIYQAREIDGFAFTDDIVVMHEDGQQVDVLLNAAPIHDDDGSISMIVATFENISGLRGLENALQDNLRETIALYEASRALSEADEIEDVLDVMIAQLMMIEPHDAAIILADEATATRTVIRTLIAPPEAFDLPSGLLKDDQSVWASDVTQNTDLSEAERDALVAYGLMSIGSVPLRTRSRETPLAWVIVSYGETHEFVAEEDRYLTTLADSAATALDNRVLFQSTEAALQEASILYQASRALADINDNQDVLDAVVDHLLNDDINQIFIALLSSFTAWDTPGTTATVVATWNADENVVDLQDVELSPDQFPAWRLLASPSPLIVNDVNTSAEIDDMERLGIESLGAQSVAILPLRTANYALGAIWMGGPVPHEYSARDVRLFEAFAEQTSLSMDAAQLFEQAERRAGQLETSAQVSQFASSILDLDMLLPRLVDLIKSAFDYDHAQIFLMDREDRYAQLQASTGEAGEQLLAIEHKLEKGSDSVIGAVTAENRPVIALDTGAVDVVHRPNPYLPDTRSEMALPLTIKGRVVGAIDVQSNQANAFGDEDVKVLTTLAAQISVAIDNAHLFEQAEHRASDMSLLFAVTTAAASAESLSDALENVADDLRDSLNALAVGIYLPVTYIDDVTGDTMMMMRPEAVAGYSGLLTELAQVKAGDDDHLIGIAADNARSNIINSVEDEPLYTPLVAGAQSAVVVPLTSASEIIGLIVMENAAPFAYNHETLTLIQTMGGTLTALIQNQQLLEQLQETNNQLLELDRIKSEFLANMSHELRTPLNSIIGFSRVILKGIDGPLTEMQEQDLSTIYNSGQHLLNLINDILDQAKIAAGKMEIKPEHFDIKAVVDGVRSIGIGLVKDKTVDIKVEVESGLPQVYGDEFRTRQVLLNLLSNATKFTNEGSIIFSVYRSTHPESGQAMVRVDVTDSGIGIAEQDLPLLFEAFRQVDSSLTRTAGGTGLGLPISKSLIEMQGGEMLVASQINAGSTFSITIPLDAVGAEGDNDAPQPVDSDTVAEPADAPVATNGHQEISGHDTLKVNLNEVKDDKRSTAMMPNVMPVKRQVLLIEDNTERVDQFRRAIQREGFDVFTASIPLEAEAMASGLRPTVIIMDVNFANGAGWDILSRIKERDDTFEIPVVVVTLSDERERALEMGAFAFMQHPIIPEELAATVLEAEQDSNTDRILIIDDQPESTRLLKQVLDEHGHYRVFEAHDGNEGMSLVARRRPDLVILDLRMPEMDGFAVLEELRANAETAHIPVLIVTGDSLNADEEGQLIGVEVMSKTDISLEDSRQFIDDVQTHLNGE